MGEDRIKDIWTTAEAGRTLGVSVVEWGRGEAIVQVS